MTEEVTTIPSCHQPTSTLAVRYWSQTTVFLMLNCVFWSSSKNRNLVCGAIQNTQWSSKSMRIDVSYQVPSKALVGMGIWRPRPQSSPLSPRKKRWSEKSSWEMDLGLIKWSLSRKAALMWSVTSYCPRKKNLFKEMIKWKHL